MLILVILFDVSAGAPGVGFWGGHGWNLSRLEGEGPVHIFVGFDKAGSSSMQNVLHASLRRKFHSPKPDFQFDAALRPILKDDVVYVSAMYNGADLVCDKLNRRPCDYFTLLRDPLDRLVSAYNYFCRDCEEEGRQCGGVEAPNYLTCPNMTLAAYASYFGNVYTRAFSSVSKPVRPPDPEFWDIGPTHLDKARDFLTSRVLAIFMDDTDLHHLSTLLRADIRNLPKSNPHAHKLHFDPDQLKTIERTYLRYDKLLYDWARVVRYTP
ncbi:hypothetical protein CTAYLR_008281 [Chrysophaeum taylorii]|uniref:Sulfotransferase n=1 Tax=Chrysophaeum taylorii TaxID=2483200 RepID=A0AAD7UA80_9STRA|nr:hypothetical protein CTAYLR_008281 [Chrysophaeum taylorii]